MSMTADQTAAAAPVPAIPAPLGDKVILWSKPACVQCTATERALDAKGIEFEELDLTERPDVVKALRESGIMQAPFVQFRDDSWSGFRPDKIDELVKRAILPSDATREARSPAR